MLSHQACASTEERKTLRTESRQEVTRGYVGGVLVRAKDQHAQLGPRRFDGKTLRPRQVPHRRSWRKVMVLTEGCWKRPTL